MPNRILKETICTSETIDQLSSEEERFFYRLLVNCDDFGRLDARPAILRSKIFPLKIGRVTEKIVCQMLSALVQVDLIKVYTIDAKPYLQVTTWEKHQQVRAKRSKYPSFDNDPTHLLSPEIICNHLLSNVTVIQSNPIQSLSESNTYTQNTQKPVKQKLGQFGNVFLTTEEYEKLQENNNGSLKDEIENLSEYKKSQGKSYANDYATLLNWRRRNTKEKVFGQKKGINDGQAIPGNKPAGAFSNLD